MSTIFVRDITPPPERIVLTLIGKEYESRIYHRGSEVAIDVTDPKEREWILSKLQNCTGLQVSVVETGQMKLQPDGIDNAGD